MFPEFSNSNCTEAQLVCYRQRDGVLEIELRTHRPSVPCPSCGGHSSRVHSRYSRRITDLPWAGLPTHILLETRRFFCIDERCSRRIFSERLPGIGERHARRTTRLRQALTWISLALGGRASERLAGRLCLPASRATMLRTLRGHSQRTTTPAPRVRELTSGPGRRGIDTGQSFAIWKQGELSICFRRAMPRLLQNGYAAIPR